MRRQNKTVLIVNNTVFIENLEKCISKSLEPDKAE